MSCNQPAKQRPRLPSHLCHRPFHKVIHADTFHLIIMFAVWIIYLSSRFSVMLLSVFFYLRHFLKYIIQPLKINLVTKYLRSTHNLVLFQMNSLFSVQLNLFVLYCLILQGIKWTFNWLALKLEKTAYDLSLSLFIYLLKIVSWVSCLFHYFVL